MDEQLANLLSQQQKQFEQLLTVFSKTILKAFGKSADALEAAEMGEPLAAPAVRDGVVRMEPAERPAPDMPAPMPLPRLPSTEPRLEVEEVKPGERMTVPRLEPPATQAERREAVIEQAAEKAQERRERLGKPPEPDVPPFRELPYMREQVFHPPLKTPHKAEPLEEPAPLPDAMPAPVTHAEAAPPPVARLEIPLPRRNHAQDARLLDAQAADSVDTVARERLIEYQQEQSLAGYRIMRRQMEMAQMLAHDLAQLQQQVEWMTDSYMTDEKGFKDIG